MLLGVSRQAVSKWEAEKAYPEMDKLLKLCDLFDCTIDGLVKGDLTHLPGDPAQSLPADARATDICGYDEMMRSFSWKIALGVALILLGVAGAAFFDNTSVIAGADPSAFSVVSLFIGVAAGLALIIPTGVESNAFRHDHPFIENFYTAEQCRKNRKLFTTCLVSGITLIFMGIVSTVILQANESLSSAVFLMFTAFGVFLIVYGSLMGNRSDLDAYNRESLKDLSDERIAELSPDKQEQVRATKKSEGLYGGIMMIATAVGLLLLFVPAFHAQSFFWLAWPIGGILCGTIAAFRGETRR